MKTLNSKLILVLATLSLAAVGCGKNGQSSGPTTYQPPIINDPGVVPVSPDGGGTGGGGGSTSAKTVAFTPVSLAEYNSYVSLHPLNAPTDFKITVDLTDAGNKRYAGSVKLSYYDTGVQYTGTFEAGSGTNVDMYAMHDAGMMEAEYNRWFILNGKYYFSAYFQDNYGAIVLVFDTYTSQGDAQGGAVVSGTVYYKNFAQSYAQASPYRKCWYIRTGPYNCRSTTVMDKSSNVPSDGFRKLGTFSNLSKAAALND